MLETSEYRKISFSGAYDMGDFFFVSSSLFNGMLKVSKETGKATYDKRFVGERTVRRGLHGKVFRYGDELIFTPDLATGIHIYNTVLNDIKYYPISFVSNNKSRCIDAFLVEDKLWLFYAYAEQPVIIFDLKSYTQETFWGIQSILPEEIKERKSPMFWGCLNQVKNVIYAGVWESAYIVQIDMDSRETKLYTLEDKESKITGIAFDGNYLWITEADSTSVKKWNSKEGVLENISAPEWMLKENRLVYCNILCHAGRVFLVPNSGEDILYVNKGSNSLQSFCKLPKEIARFNDVRKNWRRFFFYDIINEDVLRLYPVNVDMMVDVNLHTAEVRGVTFELDESWDDDKYKQNIIYKHMNEEMENKYLNETKEFNLSIYLDYVSECSETNTKQNELRIGKKVWKTTAP